MRFINTLFPNLAGQTLLVVAIALSIVIAVARWSMFTKMGKKGWKVFIPFMTFISCFLSAGAQGRHGTTSRGFLFPCSLNSEFLNPSACCSI